MSETKNYNSIDLMYYDVCFALRMLNEQISTNRYKWLFIQAVRTIFDISEFDNYIESHPELKTARIIDILNRADEIINLHNTVFVTLEKNAHKAKPEDNKTNCEYLIIEGKNCKNITFEQYQNSPNALSFRNYTSGVFSEKCAILINHITAFFPELMAGVFYSDLVNRLYTNNLVIERTKFKDRFLFIEAKHKKAEHKGTEFYEKILEEYNKHKIEKTVYKNGKYFYDESKDFITYCEQKIAELQQTASNLIDEQLEYYFSDENENNEYNYEIWNFFYKNLDISHLYQPLEFFQKAEIEFNFFDENILHISKVSKRFENLKSDKNRLYFLLYYLVPLINEKYKGVPWGVGGRDLLVFKSTTITYINDLFEEVEREFQPLESGNKSVENKKTTKILAAQKFDEIFQVPDWAKYIDALNQITPPLISTNREFIGNRKKHIGVICSWITDLKGMGKIKQDVSRSNLATVLNHEFKNFNMGTDGKTFDNVSKIYEDFKIMLLEITK